MWRSEGRIKKGQALRGLCRVILHQVGEKMEGLSRCCWEMPTSGCSSPMSRSLQNQLKPLRTRQHPLHKPGGQQWTPTSQINMYESCLHKPIMRYQEEINSHEEAFCMCMRATQTSRMELPTRKTWTALRTEEDENRVAP